MPKRVFIITVWAKWWGKLLVLLCVPRLPELVEDEPGAARSIEYVAGIQVEDLRAEVVRGISVQIPVGSLRKAIIDVFLESGLTKYVVQRE